MRRLVRRASASLSFGENDSRLARCLAVHWCSVTPWLEELVNCVILRRRLVAKVVYLAVEYCVFWTAMFSGCGSRITWCWLSFSVGRNIVIWYWRVRLEVEVVWLDLAVLFAWIHCIICYDYCWLCMPLSLTRILCLLVSTWRKTPCLFQSISFCIINWEPL